MANAKLASPERPSDAGVAMPFMYVYRDGCIANNDTLTVAKDGVAGADIGLGGIRLDD